MSMNSTHLKNLRLPQVFRGVRVASLNVFFMFCLVYCCLSVSCLAMELWGYFRLLISLVHMFFNYFHTCANDIRYHLTEIYVVN